MSLKKILTALAATAVLSTAGVSAASADDWNGNRDSQYGDHSGDRHDDRGDRHDNRGDRNDNRGDRHSDWRGHRNYVDRDRVFQTLRHHHYNRWIGDPYFYHGHYVVRSYDRFGRIVLVEIDPYTGSFIGIIRF